MTHFLPAVLESLKGCEKVVVMNGTKPWESEEPVEDKTRQIANRFRNTFVLSGEWSNEAVQRTCGVKALKDMDYVFTLDSDEILLPEDQEEMLRYAEEDQDCQAFASQIRTYYPDLGNRAIYDEGHTPIVLVRPVRDFHFSTIRCVGTRYLPHPSVVLHHLKFLQPKEDLSWRMKSKYAHEKREVLGSVPVDKSQELENFLLGLGYTNLEAELKEVRLA